MLITMKRIFISSVQKEFAVARRHLKRYISKDPALKCVFDTFVFEEDVIASDRRADEVYISEIGKSDIYLGLIGNEYGYEDSEGVSPTEREYDEATRLGLSRLIFVLGRDDGARDAKEAAFLKKISAEQIRSKCDNIDELLLEIYASLHGLLMSQGVFQFQPFDASICHGATLDDIDEEKVEWFVDRARRLRNADIEDGMPTQSVLKHLKLLSDKDGSLTNAAILLFGKNPQRFHISSEVKCVQWYGTERHKPMLSYQIYKGSLFDMADEAVAFVLSKLNLHVGTRESGAQVEREYEIPASAVAEAIINAIAHRDYSSSGSVQVELYADRLVVRNPGKINPALTKAELFMDHSSYPNNCLIADQLYQTKHIEKFGTGLTDLIHDCQNAGLKNPEIDDSHSEFVITIWRPPSSSHASDFSANNPQISRVKDSEIIAIMLSFPNLSIAGLANKLQIKYSELRYRIEHLKHAGVLKREGARKNGRWVLTSKFAGCAADGQAILNEEVELDPLLYAKLQKVADSRGVPIEIVMTQLVHEAVNK